MRRRERPGEAGGGRERGGDASPAAGIGGEGTARGTLNGRGGIREGRLVPRTDGELAGQEEEIGGGGGVEKGKEEEWVPPPNLSVFQSLKASASSSVQFIHPSPRR